jgi:hypothetical protein
MSDEVTNEQLKGLKALREPFPETAISQLPKPTKKQTDEVRANWQAGIRCTICGGWHHKDVIHLDYVGHAALTDRFLTVDPLWTWEPVSFGEDGQPIVDRDGGIWIRLTILGVTRLGYGDAGGKSGGDAMKERIGDALRNAGMRFGCALELWHKGDLPVSDDNSSKIETMYAALHRNIESVGAIKLAIREDRLESAVEAFSEISDDDKTAMHIAPTKGGIWTVEEYKTFKSNEWSAARKAYFNN